MSFAETKRSEGTQDIPDFIDYFGIVSQRDRSWIKPISDLYLTIRCSHLATTFVTFCQSYATHDRNNADNLLMKNDNTFCLYKDIMQIWMNQCS